MSDPLIERLSALPVAERDPARDERVRVQCRARLARRARHGSRPQAAEQSRANEVWQPVIAVLGAAYLTEVVVEVLRAYRLR